MALVGWLRQSTAVTIKVGPFTLVSDGDGEATALTIAQADVRLSKNAGTGAQKNDATACTHDADGMYNCPLNTTDTDTLGRLTLWVHVATALIVRQDYLILRADMYDGYFTTTGWIPANAMAPDWSITGTTLTVQTPANTASQTTKTLTGTVGANPITGVEST